LSYPDPAASAVRAKYEPGVNPPTANIPATLVLADFTKTPADV
jgi:hypothetical protein